MEKKIITSNSSIDWWEILGQIKCPVLIVRGSESELLSQEVAERMAELIPQAQLVIIERAGHHVNQANPERLYEVIEQFLARKI